MFLPQDYFNPASRSAQDFSICLKIRPSASQAFVWCGVAQKMKNDTAIYKRNKDYAFLSDSAKLIACLTKSPAITQWHTSGKEENMFDEKQFMDNINSLFWRIQWIDKSRKFLKLMPNPVNPIMPKRKNIYRLPNNFLYLSNQGKISIFWNASCILAQDNSSLDTVVKMFYRFQIKGLRLVCPLIKLSSAMFCAYNQMQGKDVIYEGTFFFY